MDTGIVEWHAKHSSWHSGISTPQNGHGDIGSFSSTFVYFRMIFSIILLCTFEIEGLFQNQHAHYEKTSLSGKNLQDLY